MRSFAFKSSKGATRSPNQHTLSNEEMMVLIQKSRRITIKLNYSIDGFVFARRWRIVSFKTLQAVGTCMHAGTYTVTQKTSRPTFVHYFFVSFVWFSWTKSRELFIVIHSWLLHSSIPSHMYVCMYSFIHLIIHLSSNHANYQYSNSSAISFVYSSASSSSSPP